MRKINKKDLSKEEYRALKEKKKTEKVDTKSEDLEINENTTKNNSGWSKDLDVSGTLRNAIKNKNDRSEEKARQILKEEKRKAKTPISVPKPAATEKEISTTEVEKSIKSDDVNPIINNVYNIVCVKHGDKYSADYVNKLYSMCKRHCTLD